MAKLEPIECKQCGKIFVPTHWNSKTCSDECRVIARKISVDNTNRKAKERREKEKENSEIGICIVCGAKFLPRNCKNVTCGNLCSLERRKQNQIQWRQKKGMKKFIEKPKSIAEMNAEARKMGMSYGQYDLYLRMHGKEKQNVL